MPFAGQVDKTMGADTVGHLKHLLETELKRAREENDLDIAMFSGVDGRIFSSSIPNQLDPREYRLLNLLKGNLANICNQVRGQNMIMSVQQFEAGTIIISGVGERAFLVFLTTKPVEITKMQGVLANVVKTSIVVRHLFESKPITPEVLASYDEAVAGELKRLTRILFVEKFGETKEFKKNKEIAQYLQSKLAALVGPGLLQEIVTMAYNEVGTTAPYMTSAHWERFLTMLLDRLREIEGDAVAAKAEKEWRAHLKQVLSSFVSCPWTEVTFDRRRARLAHRGHDREGRGRRRRRVLAAGRRQPREPHGEGGVPRVDVVQRRRARGPDGLQHRRRGDAAHGHGHHGCRRGRGRLLVRDAAVLLRPDDLPHSVRRRPDEPGGPGRNGRVQRERPQHRGLQLLRVPRAVPGGDREEHLGGGELARVLPARHARLERGDEDLLEERGPGEHQRGPHARPPTELRVRLRARHARRPDQGGTLRWRPNLGCRRAIHLSRSRRTSSWRTSPRRSASRGSITTSCLWRRTSRHPCPRRSMRSGRSSSPPCQRASRSSRPSRKSVRSRSTACPRSVPRSSAVGGSTRSASGRSRRSTARWLDTTITRSGPRPSRRCMPSCTRSEKRRPAASAT